MYFTSDLNCSQKWLIFDGITIRKSAVIGYTRKELIVTIYLSDGCFNKEVNTLEQSQDLFDRIDREIRNE